MFLISFFILIASLDTTALAVVGELTNVDAIET